MTKASIDLQDLRRRLYVKAKAETSWRFWGLYVHVCKMETLREAYALAKKNDGAPGVDGVTFAVIEAQGVEAFLGQIRDELVGRTYVPLPARRQEIPKDGGKVRILSTRARYMTLETMAPLSDGPTVNAIKFADSSEVVIKKGLIRSRCAGARAKGSVMRTGPDFAAPIRDGPTTRAREFGTMSMPPRLNEDG